MMGNILNPFHKKFQITFTDDNAEEIFQILKGVVDKCENED